MSLWQILETFSHYQQVSFAFYCAKEVETLANDPRIIDCNNTIQSWLNGDKSVDLITARNNAWNAYSTAADSDTAASAAAAHGATYSASHAAVHIAVRAAVVSNAFYHATRAKSFNLHPNNNDQRNIAHNQFYNEYEQIAQNWLSLWQIPNFPKDEPDFPLFDFLQDYNLISYLLPKKDNFYYLNLNGFDIKHVNEAELLKLINTIHIKKILRRIINNDLSS